MDILFGIVIALGLIILANIVEKRQRPTEIRLFEWALFFVNIPLILQGSLYIFLPEQQLTNLNINIGTRASGFVLLGIGVWGAVLCYRPLRELLAQWLPINPQSPVHTLALILSGYLIGNPFLVITEGGLETLADTAISVGVVEIVLQQFLFSVLAFLGVGLFFRRNNEALQERLGLERPTRPQLLLGLRWIPILVIVQSVIGVIWSAVNPEQAQQLGDISNALLGDMNSLWEWFALALSAGIGEELLFRGALQPVLGLWFTAVLFAAAHIQYGLTPATLAVFIIAVVLGIIRQRTNTTVAIFVHFGYNFILGLLALLAAYLEPLAR